MRTWLLKLHRWAGLGLGIIIFVLAVTGSALVFENDIDATLNADLMFTKGNGQRILLQQAVDAARKAHPQDPPVSMRVVPNGLFAQERTIELSLKSRQTALVNPYTGEVLGTRNQEKSFARFLHLLHTRLVAGQTGEYVTGAVTFVTFLMALSGLYLWWPRKLLSLKTTPSWRRTNLDLHHVLGFWGSAVMVTICLSGVLIAFEEFTEPMLKKLDSRPAPTANLESTPQPGRTPISVDEAVRLANAALPGATTTAINIPSPGKAVYRALLKFPEDRTPAGRSRVVVDQWSGKVLQTINTREAELGTRISNLKRSAHTGDIFGWPTRALYFIASLMIAGQVVSGFLIWWKPGKLAQSQASEAREETASEPA